MFAIYPVKKVWSEAEIRLALSDEIRNGIVDQIGDTPFDVNQVSLELACQLLADTGKVTWGACNHNEMVERDDQEYAWQCADCGYIYAEF